MSLVVFPFKVEDPEILLRNTRFAAEHPRVKEVLLVGASREETFEAVSAGLDRIRSDSGVRIDIIVQDRLGSLRPGKGDGMNTALRYFLDESSLERIHFYDSDIVNFGARWMDQAERAADLGFDVVRHYFPRARTDAMITWMVTRTGFARIWPRSGLSWIGQPLGGELLFTRAAVEHLVSDERVMAQSDWGIDTLYTFSTTQAGFPVYESYMPIGKLHRLYGALSDLRTMIVECFAAVQGLREEEVREDLVHRAEVPEAVPASVTEKLGFDIEATLGLMKSGWSERQASLLESFPARIRDGLLANRENASFQFMDDDAWYDAYGVLVEHYQRGDADWEELLFKLWMARVLGFATTVAIRGYGYSQAHLSEMISRYRQRAAGVA
jgi:mannosylglycerate synthase